MQKNGFSLSECVVSICIVIIMGVLFVSVSLWSVSNSNRSTITEITNNESLNVVTLVKNIELENSGEYSPEKLQNAILNLYSKSIDLSLNELVNIQSLELKYDLKGNQVSSGTIKLKFDFFKRNEFFCVNLSTYYSEKEIQGQTLLFEKLITGWKE